MSKKKDTKDKGGVKMGVSKACVPCLSADIAKKFKEDIASTKINLDIIKEGKSLLNKLIEQRRKDGK